MSLSAILVAVNFLVSFVPHGPELFPDNPACLTGKSLSTPGQVDLSQILQKSLSEKESLFTAVAGLKSATGYTAPLPVMGKMTLFYQEYQNLHKTMIAEGPVNMTSYCHRLKNFIRDMAVNHAVHKSGNDLVGNFTGLVRVILGDNATWDQKQMIKATEEGMEKVNNLFRLFFPEAPLYRSETVRTISDGAGVTVAVFDNFEEDILERQRKLRPSADIHSMVRFGNPVSLSHGNSVVDILLNTAPGAVVIPVSAEPDNTKDALKYILNNPAALISLSR